MNTIRLLLLLIESKIMSFNSKESYKFYTFIKKLEFETPLKVIENNFTKKTELCKTSNPKVSIEEAGDIFNPLNVTPVNPDIEIYFWVIISTGEIEESASIAKFIFFPFELTYSVRVVVILNGLLLEKLQGLEVIVR